MNTDTHIVLNTVVLSQTEVQVAGSVKGRWSFQVGGLEKSGMSTQIIVTPGTGWSAIG